MIADRVAPLVYRFREREGRPWHYAFALPDGAVCVRKLTGPASGAYTRILDGSCYPSERAKLDGRNVAEWLVSADGGYAAMVARWNNRSDVDPGCVEVERHPWRAGEYPPRMWVPGDGPPTYVAADGALEGCARSAFVLMRAMEDLFDVVDPNAESNMTAHGHAIRNLLVLAATEVEAAWVGVLRANGAARPDGRYTTNHYVKLCEPMLLQHYRLRLLWHPEAKEFTPFSGWEAKQPTTSLPWYDAYNAAKHDRAANLHRATLGHAIQAVAAVVVMLYAQFGAAHRGETRRGPEWHSEVERHFSVTLPEFDTALPRDRWLMPVGTESDWVAARYFA